jgi:hypothetical protein
MDASGANAIISRCKHDLTVVCDPKRGVSRRASASDFASSSEARAIISVKNSFPGASPSAEAAAVRAGTLSDVWLRIQRRARGEAWMGLGA